MPKASFASKDTYAPSIFQEGNAEIQDAASAVYQYPPNRETGETFPPFLAGKLVLKRLDENWHQTDEEPVIKYLRMERDLSRMRPGSAKDREDPDPEDLGDEIDTEGNSVFSSEGSKISASSQWGVFTKTLEEHGVKPELLAEGFLPDLVGIRFHAFTEKQAKRTINGREIEPNYFKADRVMFDKSGASKKPPAKAASAKPAGPVKVNGPVAVPAPTSVSEAAELAASAIMAELAAELAGETRDSSRVFAMAYARLVRDKQRDKKLDKEVSDLLRSDEWHLAHADDFGYSLANGSFSFGAAA